MNRPVSLALLVIGCILVIYGISAADSVSSDLSRLFTGAPTDRAVWLLIIGALAAIMGLGGLFRGSKLK